MHAITAERETALHLAVCRAVANSIDVEFVKTCQILLQYGAEIDLMARLSRSNSIRPGSHFYERVTKNKKICYIYK